MQRDQAGDDSSPITVVAVSAPVDTTAPTGPETAEGISIGSTLDDARAAYPDAEALESVGDRRHLKVDDSGDSALFLTYTEGATTVWELAVTSLEMPPYEPCA